MNWLLKQLRVLQPIVGRPPLLALIILVDVVAYFGGLLYWYGPVMADPATPLWTWPFIPDCPLFGFLGGLGLLMVTARTFWSEPAQLTAQRWLWGAAILSTGVWLSTYLSGAPAGWQGQSALWGLWAWVMIVGAIFFRRAPRWLLTIFALGQIKYGVWTVTAWLLFWRNTALAFGAPLFTFDSVFMTLTHIGLIGQGLLLLTYFRPNVTAALAAFAWFGFSDFVDYGLGYYPAIPEIFIPLRAMQWSTIGMTFLLAGWSLWTALRVARTFSSVAPSHPQDASRAA